MVFIFYFHTIFGLSNSTRKMLVTYSLPIRIVSGAISAIEGVRIFPVIVVLCVLVLNALLDKIKLLIKEVNVDRFVQLLNRVHTTIAPCKDFADALGSLFTCSGVIAMVVINLMLLRFFWLLPIPVNLIPPTVFVFLNFFIQLILPPAIRVNESSSDAIMSKKSLLMSKYLRKKLNATRPLVFRGGVFGTVFFKVTRDFKSEIYLVILQTSTDVLLGTKDINFVG